MSGIFSNLMSGIKKGSSTPKSSDSMRDAEVPVEAPLADEAPAATTQIQEAAEGQASIPAAALIASSQAQAQDIAPPSVPAGGISSDAEELEEWSEPLPDAAALASLPVGSTLPLSQGGILRVVEVINTKPEINIYKAAFIADVLAAESTAPADPASSDVEAPLRSSELSPEASTEDGGELSGNSTESAAPSPPLIELSEPTESSSFDELSVTTPVRLREAVGASALRLEREATMRAALNTPLVPRGLAFFQSDGRSYLAEEMPAATMTLASLLESRGDLSDILHVLAQVAAALSRLHATGWAHLGLRPEIIALGKPVQLTDFSFIARLGEIPAAPISQAGYSAPELAQSAPVDARSDIYSLGALLYHAISGGSIPETGPELEAWMLQQPVPGVPQILRRCLGEVETRYNFIDELHRDLIRLKNRLKPAIHYTLAAASTIGLEPTRTTNQDAFGYLTGVMQSEAGGSSWAVACVADGMGGMAAGEVASEAAVQTVLAEAVAACTAQAYTTALPAATEQAQWTKGWASAANEKVCAALQSRKARGGCTFMCAFLVERRLSIAHVGDCRIYLWRGAAYQLLSRDHSFVMALVLQNEITLDDVRSHPERNKVTRSLGDRHPLPEYFVDTLETRTGEATMELEPGDVLLLCSDGLWEPVLESEMTKALQDHALDLHAAAQQVLRVALQRGAPDNATIVLLRVDEVSDVSFPQADDSLMLAQKKCEKKAEEN